MQERSNETPRKDRGQMDPDITYEIQRRIQQLEDEEDILIFYACESGSRAWGFPSRDSDYDVRFLYLRPIDWYLSINQRSDVIEPPIDGVFDFSGCDIRKALHLLRKSNPPLLEWLKSPIVYLERNEICERFKALSERFYSPRSCMYHYLHMAQGNFREYLKGEEVWLKKYLYVLRPILACLWIERYPEPVPMEFGVLLDRIVEAGELRAAIDDLLGRKREGQELDSGSRIPVINDFAERELERLSKIKPPASDPKKDVEILNDFYRWAIRNQ